MKEVLVSYKVLLNNQIKDARISVPMAIAMAKDLLAENQSDFALVNVETMLAALENLKGRIYLPGSATFFEPDDKKDEPVAAPKPEPKRRWLNVDLSVPNAFCFKRYLREKGIKYETSDVYGVLVHFEVLCTDEEAAAANDELDLINSIMGTL